MPQFDTDTSTSTSTAQPSTAAVCSVDVAMPAELLAQIASGLGTANVTEALPQGAGRRWALLLESDAYEAWVIAWPAGTGLEMHDHDGSAASIHVVSGRLRERFVDRAGDVIVRWLDAGDTVVLAHDHRHEAVNLDAEQVVSVHVYSPRLKDQSFRATKAIA